MKKAWLISLLLHGLAIGAIFLAPAAEQAPRAARLVDVDLLERASRDQRIRSVASAPSKNERADEPSMAPETASVADGADVVGNAALVVEYRPAPSYPTDAQEAGLEGDILVEVRTDEAGFVESVELVRSSGHAVLDQSVISTVKTWRLKPLKTVRVPISFHLDS